jgi:tripartite-type tricarboxylate transporter receptor subunit TctC
MPLLLKEFAGMNARLVPGYADNSEILLAVERKEVDGWAALGAGVTLGVNRGVVRAIVRTRATVPGFMDLPVDETLTTDPIGKSLMALRAIPLQIGRAFAVRAGTPSDRVAILRDALAKVAADPETIAEAAKANIVLDFSPHEAVEGAFSEMFSQPPEVLAVMSRYLKPLN